MTRISPDNRFPRFIYGTAWKAENTCRLVGLALDAGFRAIDTANQRKHYFETGVGEALKQKFSEGILRREDLFLQTKFTYPGSQDNRLPYHLDAAPADQVRQSFLSSLEHLEVEYLDSYILHGPSVDRGLTPVDHEVWRTMEELKSEGKTRFLGVSNISLEQLKLLCDGAETLPTFVQNRCFANTGWDRQIRAFCRESGITYQGFSLLTANARELLSREFRKLVQDVGGTISQVVFRFANQIGIIPLTGTTNPDHMREDLAFDTVNLTDADIKNIEGIAEKICSPEK
ncbi:MAG: aldo/keto reductase [Candidatus Riflebacteria bacterium]|nr:aldo/keto reductase [Candidatus Riflebacteria bacterium]